MTPKDTEKLNNSTVMADFGKVLKRIKRSGLQNELLIRAAKPERQRAARTAEKGPDGTGGTEVRLTAIDGTAGFGEDSFLLAAAGYEVTMIERDPEIAAVLRSALEMAEEDEELAEITGRMRLTEGDSVREMKKLPVTGELSPGTDGRYDLIYLDPMFPDDGKSALSKKKLQFIRDRQDSLDDEEGRREEEERLLKAAMALSPRKIVIKRPLKGPYLGGVTPGYSIKGKLIRYDCIVL